MGLLLLILMLVVQVLAPAATAATSPTAGHDQHLQMAAASGDCPMQMLQPGADVHDQAGRDTAHQGTAHCMPSICCFHDTSASPQLVAMGALLPDTRVIDRGTAASSSIGSTQKRPPKRV
jgi:hypothetical protein